MVFLASIDTPDVFPSHSSITNHIVLLVLLLFMLSLALAQVMFQCTDVNLHETQPHQSTELSTTDFAYVDGPAQRPTPTAVLLAVYQTLSPDPDESNRHP